MPHQPHWSAVDPPQRQRLRYRISSVEMANADDERGVAAGGSRLVDGP
jgi:hypothetical protein